MPEVEFHTGVADRVDYACRLLRSAWRSAVRVQLTGDDALLAAVDRALWVAPERDFVPHVRVPRARAAVAARTPIWLVDGALPGDGWPAPPPVLVNAGGDGFELQGLDRVIEVVSNHADDVARGRERWRAYRERGVAVRHVPAGDG